MAWDITQVREAISETDEERTTLVTQMDKYEKAWRLDFWDASDYKLAAERGWKLYTSPDPRNAVGMAMNLLNGKIKVNCPTQKVDGAEVMNARTRARFLELLIDKQTQLHDMSLLEELGWYGSVKGRMVIQVAWIWNQLNDEQKKFMPPIIYRALDPKACGFKRDAFGVQWAYYRYKDKIDNAKSKYPDFFGDKQSEGILPSQSKTRSGLQEVEIVIFYYMDKGKPWHCVLIDNEFAKEPEESQFPKIPLFERNNDPAPASKERWRSGSILEGMLETWAELNYLHSMHITAVTKKFMPPAFFSNDNNRKFDPIDMGPDAVNVLPEGVRPLQRPDDRPDVNLLSSMIEEFSQYQQRATFPNSIYGETGAQRAAYGQHMMMSTAARRVQPLRSQIESILTEANELALCMIAKFGAEDITMYGYNRSTNTGEQITLNAEAVGDRYDNTVTLEIVVPGSSMQNANLAIQFKRERLLSSGTALRVGAPPEWYIPEDEQLRILEEEIQENEQIRKDILDNVYFQATGRRIPQPPPPPQEPPQQIPPMGQPGPMQGGNPDLMMGSPEFQGGMSPDMMGMPQGDPETQMMMAMMNGGGMPGPVASDQMMNNAYRRR